MLVPGAGPWQVLLGLGLVLGRGVPGGAFMAGAPHGRTVGKSRQDRPSRLVLGAWERGGVSAEPKPDTGCRLSRNALD
jgi:hypothetical protein